MPVTIKDPLPSRIGDYSVVRKIGQGAMSNVYLCVHDQTYASVAIKKLKPQCLTSDHFDMFAAEIDYGHRLDHKNIVKVHHGNKQDGYMVMSYFNGISLDHHDSDDHLLPFNTIMSVLSQTAQALKYANESGIIHRDIKPANILLSKDGTVKLTDFGCAVPSGEIADLVAGSLAYMSPEQLLGERIDERADIYSLGMVAYRLLTGRPAFEEDNRFDLKTAIIHFAPVHIHKHRDGLPPDLTALIHQSISNDASKRPTWGEFIDRIGAISHAIALSGHLEFDAFRGMSKRAYAFHNKNKDLHEKSQYSRSGFSMSSMKM